MSGRELPTGWVVVPLAEIANSQLGKMLDKAKRTAGTSLPYLRNVNVRWGEFDLSDLSEMPFTANELDRFGLCDGDVLICEGGEPGRAAIWRGGNTPIKFQKALHRVRLLGGCDPRWLAFHLRKDAAAGELSNFFTGTTIKHFTGEALRRYPVDLPPLPEQMRIVEKIEALVARSRRAREALDSLPGLMDHYRQSILAAAFRGDLTADWRNNAERNKQNASLMLARNGIQASRSYGVLSPGWAWCLLGNLLTSLRNGLSRRPSEEAPGLPILRISAVRPFRVDCFQSKFYQSEDGEEVDRYFLEPGDVLFTRYNGNADLVGVAGVYRSKSGRFLYPDKIIRARVISEKVLLPDFLEIAVNSGISRKCIQSMVKTSAGQHGISGGDLKTVPIPIPPIDEQAEIVRIVRGAFRMMDDLALRISEVSSRLATLDQSILAKAFRGELVPQDPNDEPASVLLERIRAERAAAGPAPRRGRRPKAAGG